MLGLVFLQDVVLDGTPELGGIDPLPLGGRDIETKQDDGRSVDRHGHGDLIQRDPVEQRSHVVQRRDGDAAHSDLTQASRVVRVVAHERREIECNRKTRLAVLEQVLVALVRLFGRGEARELTHRPQTGPIHRGVGSTRERELPRHPELFVVRRIRQIEGRIQRADLTAGNRLERLFPGGQLSQSRMEVRQLRPQSLEFCRLLLDGAFEFFF